MLHQFKCTPPQREDFHLTDAPLTFVFVVGELLVGHSEPSLFEVLLAEPLFPLSAFLYFPKGEQAGDVAIKHSASFVL